MQTTILFSHTDSHKVSYMSGKFIPLLILACLSGYAAITTAISKRHLDVQTRMSATIFLDPVTPDKRVAFVQVRNIADKPNLDMRSSIASVIMAKRYRLTNNLDEAHYLVQANPASGQEPPLRSTSPLAGGYGRIEAMPNDPAMRNIKTRRTLQKVNKAERLDLEYGGKE